MIHRHFFFALECIVMNEIRRQPFLVIAPPPPLFWQKYTVDPPQYCRRAYFIPICVVISSCLVGFRQEQSIAKI